jgi:proliferating cell nuclear antigen
MATTAAGLGVDPASCTVYMKSIQGGAIRTLFEVLKEIVHDVALKFTADGVHLVTADGARCALINMTLDADKFEEYHCAGATRVGLNVNLLFKLVRIAGSHDTVTMYVRPEESNELGILVQNSEKNQRTDFKMKLLDVNYEDFELPEQVFDTVITMPSATLQRLCRDMSQLDDHVTIASRDGTLVLTCVGERASQETVIGQADEGLVMSTNAPTKGKFSLKYLCLFAKASSLCNSVEIYVKREYPIILKYYIASLGALTFVLAEVVQRGGGDDDSGAAP